MSVKTQYFYYIVIMSNSRHSRKTLPHVCNDVHNCTSMIFHPCIVCYELRAKPDLVAFEFVMRNCQHVISEIKFTICTLRSKQTVCLAFHIAICAEPSLQHKNVPLRLVSITAFQPFALILFTGLENCPPPLFTKKSILP